MGKAGGGAGALSAVLDMGEELVGTAGGAVYLRCVYHQEDSLGLLARMEGRTREDRDELGGCHRVRTGGGVLRKCVYLPELPDSFFVYGEITAGGRLSVCEQAELWAQKTDNTALHASGTAYVASHGGKELRGVAAVEV